MKRYKGKKLSGLTGPLWLGGLFCLACASAQAQGAQDEVSYLDGTLLVNEGRFNADNGSVNYLMPNGEVAYNVFLKENPGMELGVTTCDAIAFANRVFVSSKNGNHLVVLDGKSLKQVKVLSDLKEEARGLVGVNAKRAYAGTMGGIFPVDLDSLAVGPAVPGTLRGGAYAAQPGDMVAVNGRVFVALQKKGLLVIDAEKNEVVKLIEEPDVQSVVQAFDGRLWMATKDRLQCVDAELLEVTETRRLPAKGKIMCQWGAWKPAALVASSRENVLFWNAGSEWSGGNDFYRLELDDQTWGEDLSELKPFFTLKGVAASGEDKQMELYGTMEYDGRADELVMMTVQSGFGDNFLYNWVLRVDAASGELKAKVALKENYWFPSLPVIPDKMAPFLAADLEELRLVQGCAAHIIDLKGKYGDEDNLGCNVRLSLVEAGDAAVAVAELDGEVLTVDVKAPGETELKLAVESNGRVTEKVIPVTVSPATGIREELMTVEVVYANGMLRVTGCQGRVLSLYGIDGTPLKQLTVDSREWMEELYLPAGVYLWKTDGEAGGKLMVR